MERTNATGSTDAQSERQFYLPAVSTSSEASLAERFFTTLFRERGELVARVRRE
jgi:hypothetical protein